MIKKKIMEQKITLNIKGIVALIIIVVSVKYVWFTLPEIKPIIEEYAYATVTNDFDVKSVKDLRSNIERKYNSVKLYYIGRGSCGDCRASIRNIKCLKNLAEKEYDMAMNYIKLKNEISKEERYFLDNLDVDGIPILLLVKNGEIKRFDFYDITAENFTERFKKFVEQEVKV